MKQWEYSTLLVGYNHWVLEYNGLRVNEITQGREGQLTFRGKYLIGYLELLGQDGWDVIAVVPTSGGEGCNKYMVILKRPAS